VHVPETLYVIMKYEIWLKIYHISPIIVNLFSEKMASFL